MPELPEVETIRQDLRKHLVGKKIKNIKILLPRIIKSDLENFSSTLLCSKIREIDRIGKLIIVALDSHPESFLLIHLKMTGQLIYCSKAISLAGGHSDKNLSVCAENKHTRVIFDFANDGRLYFNDLRTFGVLKIVGKQDLEKEKSKFGIEPLQKNFKLSDLAKIFKKSYRPIKSVLLDQNKISGIGNIYADEILFDSGILPQRPAASLSEVEIANIFKSSQRIIKKAIKSRGTTFNNYVDGQGQKGSYTKELKVYGRGKQACLKCGKTLSRNKIAGRGTVYCQFCQK
jgi:formamidopyrimidine-DNA glycosylase